MTFQYLICVRFQTTSWDAYGTRKNDVEIIGMCIRHLNLCFVAMFHLHFILSNCSIRCFCSLFLNQNSRHYYWIQALDSLNRFSIILCGQRIFPNSAIIVWTKLDARKLSSINRARLHVFTINLLLGCANTLLNGIWCLQCRKTLATQRHHQMPNWMQHFARGRTGSWATICIAIAYETTYHDMNAWKRGLIFDEHSMYVRVSNFDRVILGVFYQFNFIVKMHEGKLTKRPLRIRSNTIQTKYQLNPHYYPKITRDKWMQW